VKKLEIDFVGRGRASPWPGRMLLALAVAFSFDVGISYQDARSSLQVNEAKIAKAQARSSAPAKPVSPEEVAAVRETVERLAMPWDTLFGALEAAATDQVALLGIEPDPKAGTVVISGDSKDYLAALTYVLNLSRAEALTRVQLLRHEAKSDHAQAPVSFAVSAAWSKAR
jgi:Tfp pilus assembly protein PilN